jgi:FkbM family methyltransferase
VSIISYAQNFEDVMLWRALGHIEHGFYIDIGAQDPIIDSVSLAFHEHGWRGIHVEPTPQYAELLRQARPEDIVIQAAVGFKSGIQCFYEFPDTGLSTTDRQIAEEHISKGFPAKEIVVPSVTLDEVFSRGTGEEIHWLKIDVEGAEKQVLRGWVDTALRPWILLIESTYPNTQIETHQQWESLILAKGYTFAYFDGLSRFYVADGHDELFKAFSSGPNIFDVMFCGFGLSATTPFCATLNSQILSLKEQREREQLEAELRFSLLESELTEKVRAHKAEVSQVTQSSAIELKERSAQLQAGQQELKDLLRNQAQREKEHAEQTSQTQQELETLLRTQDQREQEVAAQLLTIQQQAEKEKTAQAQQHIEQTEQLRREHAGHEQQLQLQLQAEQQQLRNLQTNWIERERHLTELSSHAQQEINTLLHTLAQREQEVTAQLRDLQQQAEREKTAQAQQHIEQTEQLRRKHNEREQQLNDQIATLKHQIHTLTLNTQQLSSDLSSKQDELNNLLQTTATLETQLNTQLHAEQHTSQQLRQTLAELEQALQQIVTSRTWRLTAPLRWLPTRTNGKPETANLSPAPQVPLAEPTSIPTDTQDQPIHTPLP